MPNPLFQQPNNYVNPTGGFFPQARNAISNFTNQQTQNTPITGNVDPARNPIPTSVSNSNQPGSLSGYIQPQGGALPPGGTTNASNQNTGSSNTTGVLPGTNFPQNLGGVLNASNLSNNPEYQQGTQNALLINAAQQNAALAPYAGAQNTLNQNSTNLLGTPYSNIFRPQSTGNLQGELGVLNPELSQAGNFATGEQQAAIQAGQLATQGASTVAGLTAPQQQGLYSTLYSPGTVDVNAQNNQLGNRAQIAGQTQGQVATSEQATQNAAVINKAIQGELPGLNQAISSSNFNPSSVTGINALNQWVQSGLSNSAYPQVTGALNSVISSLASTLGVPGGATTDFKLGMAGSIVNQLQSGSSIQDAINFAANQALTANQAYANGAQNPSLGGNSGGNTGSLYSW